MHLHPKPFGAYILPFLAVIPLTLSFYALLNSLQDIRVGTTLNALSLRTWEKLNSDLNYLEDQGNQVAKNPSIVEHLVNKNYETLLTTLLSEGELRRIGIIELTNADGYAVTRTNSFADLGEQLFVTTPQGRALASGAPTLKSIETYTSNEHQALMTTGRFIYYNDEKIGAIFADSLLDNSYATQLRQEQFEFVATKAEIAFYTDIYGIYSTSLPDTASAETISAYFTPEHIPAPNSVSTFTFDGQDYVVKNLSFKGLEGSHTGALLFLPVVSQSQLAIEAFVIALALALLSDLALSRSKR